MGKVNLTAASCASWLQREAAAVAAAGTKYGTGQAAQCHANQYL
jgi:hypothetical protein